MPLFTLTVGRYRFRPGLWPTVAFALLFPLLLSLGLWQTERAQAKRDLVERNAAGEVTAVLDLRSPLQFEDGDRYRRATVRGEYIDEQQWLLDNRVYAGQAGYHVFTPFVIAGDRKPSLLINRGWVSVGHSREDLPLLPVPKGEVDLQGRLDRPASVALVVGEVPLESVESRVRVQSLDIAALAEARQLPLAPMALVIDEGQPGGLQYDWSPMPQMGPEKHLGYAVQWFGLAVALLIIYVGVNTRRNDRDGGAHVGI